MELHRGMLNKTIPIPLYFQLKELILADIKSGKSPYGSMIPTENEFVTVLNVSRTTVRQAITELVQEGWLYRVKSKGTFVSEPKLQQDFATKIEPFEQQMQRLGKVPRTEVLELIEEKASADVAQALQIEVGSKVVLLHRRRFADEEAIVRLRTYLPFDRCGYLLQEDLVHQSLYSFLREDKKTEIAWIKRKIETTEATAEDEKWMEMKKGKPILVFTSIGYNIMNEPIEYSIAHYRGDRNSFEISVLPATK